MVHEVRARTAVSIPACHAEDRDSFAQREDLFLRQITTHKHSSLLYIDY